MATRKECTLCKKAHEESGSSWNKELPKETIGHIQSAGCLGQKEVVIAAHSSLGTLWDQEQCTQFCSKEELWEAAKEEEMKIPWKDEKEGSPAPEEQYQERFWRRRLDGIGLDTVNKELLAIVLVIEFKRTRDARSNYVEKATAVAGAVHKFANGSPSGRSSQRVEGTTTCVCRRDVRICSC